MVTIEKEILIKAPPEEIFSFIEDPVHLPEIWPSMVEVKDVVELPTGGRRYHWIYKMAGMKFEGESETVEFEPNKHVFQKSTGEIPSAFDWRFVPENGSTKVFLKAEYELPQTLLGKVRKPFLLKLNEREADSVLFNLKDRIEN